MGGLRSVYVDTKMYFLILTAHAAVGATSAFCSEVVGEQGGHNAVGAHTANTPAGLEEKPLWDSAVGADTSRAAAMRTLMAQVCPHLT
jgi:hypothetical protein